MTVDSWTLAAVGVAYFVILGYLLLIERRR